MRGRVAVQSIAEGVSRGEPRGEVWARGVQNDPCLKKTTQSEVLIIWRVEQLVLRRRRTPCCFSSWLTPAIPIKQGLGFPHCLMAIWLNLLNSPRLSYRVAEMQTHALFCAGLLKFDSLIPFAKSSGLNYSFSLLLSFRFELLIWYAAWVDVFQLKVWKVIEEIRWLNWINLWR